jgi:predicted AAA+ superfamily ATPase
MKPVMMLLIGGKIFIRSDASWYQIHAADRVLQFKAFAWEVTKDRRGGAVGHRFATDSEAEAFMLSN